MDGLMTLPFLSDTTPEFNAPVVAFRPPRSGLFESGFRVMKDTEQPVHQMGIVYG